MSQPLQGKVALVSGAGKNIGRAIALALAGDGACIVVNGRADKAAVDGVVREIEAAGGKAMAAMGDVADPAVPPRLAAEAAARFGGVDILVSNAGLRRQTSFLDMSFEEWREIMSVALDGAFLLGKAIIPQMVARGGGAFVALSGISTHVGTPNRCHVSASKSGLEGLMRALAVELAPHKITCNALSPGAIDTARGAAAGPAPPNVATLATTLCSNTATVTPVAARTSWALPTRMPGTSVKRFLTSGAHRHSHGWSGR